MPRLFIVAAENSAENYGAEVIDAFKKKDANISFVGVGGDQFIKRGVEVVIHRKQLSLIGIVEVISSLFRIKRYFDRLCRVALEQRVDAALLIDFPDFNLRLARKFKRAGIPVYYYIGPTVWAWRYRRIHLIRKLVRHMFIIFPFETAIYEKERVPHSYTGHPLLKMVKVDQSRESFRRSNAVRADQVLLTILPGSRISEVNSLLPEIVSALSRLRLRYDLQVGILRAQGIEEAVIRKILADYDGPVQVFDQREGYNLINASDLVITTCGTSNLEISILGVPFVAVYRVQPLTYLFGKPFIKIKRYSITNIIAGKSVVPELIQGQFNEKSICREVVRILEGKRVSETMKEEFKRIQQTLKTDRNPTQIIVDKILSDLSE